MTVIDEEAKEYTKERSIYFGCKLLKFLKSEEMVGDLLSIDYTEATIIVHDAQRQNVGGLPMGCFLLATRLELDAKPAADAEDTSLILLRVVRHAALPNRIDTENWRFAAALRSIDSDQQWDSDTKSDQFTLNQLRHAGVRCSVLGTLRYSRIEDDWRLSFGADISNFYSGQGMKIYKPMGEALSEVVNFAKPTGGSHPLSGKPVAVGRVRYSSTEYEVDESRSNVQVNLEPTDMLARRTALFGISRSGKSNTIKTLASAIFNLRRIDSETGRVGQLIFDLNGEYCNDNPQDEGCLRNIDQNDVVTYGLFKHPHDPGRRLIKLNFFGEYIGDWTDQEAVESALTLLIAGKTMIDEHLHLSSDSQYIRNFIVTSMGVPTASWGKGDQVRYRRNITVYRAILAAASFELPSQLSVADIRGLFSNELITAMNQTGEQNFVNTAKALTKPSLSWSEFHSALNNLQQFVLGKGQNQGHNNFKTFNKDYEIQRGKPWNDDTLNGLLSILKWAGGTSKIRELKDRHNPDIDNDYSTEIVDELVSGKLVIVDQSIGAPEEIEQTSARMMWTLFNRQKEKFTAPERNDRGDILSPPDVIVYVEEAHNLLPSQNAKLDSIWARIAKEGSKFRIGLVYSTQEPSSILSNILKNTENWFVAHLNNQDEMRELRKYYDFDLFAEQILKVPDTGFVRMRCLSNPYIVPVQINQFTASPTRQGGMHEGNSD